MIMKKLIKKNAAAVVAAPAVEVVSAESFEVITFCTPDVDSAITPPRTCASDLFSFLHVMTDLSVTFVQYVFPAVVAAVHTSYRKTVAIEASMSSNKIYQLLCQDAGATINEMLALRKPTEAPLEARQAAIVKLVKEMKKHNKLDIVQVGERYFCKGWL
jgi:hypothetical protein